MKYIDYSTLKEFYTIQETCALFEMSKDALRAKSEEYGISPSRSEFGQAGFYKYDKLFICNSLHFGCGHEVRR